jgi:hypothetical protein
MSARPKGKGRWVLALLLGCLVLFLTAPIAQATTTEVRGKVTSAASGEPISEVEVRYYTSENAFARFVTNAKGEYGENINMSSGEFKVEFVPPAGSKYAFQYYKEKTSYQTATPVTVEANKLNTTIHAALSEGGAISGVVTDAMTHQPVAGIGIEAFSNGDDAPVSMGYSNAGGAYTLSGIPSGSVDVAFFSRYQPEEVLYSPQVYDDQPFEGYSELFLDGNPVQVIAPHTTSRINASLIREEPVDTVAPVLSGTPAVGHPLTCSTGTWTGSEPLTYTYAWLRDGAPIAGASEYLYVAQAADQGQVLLCEVTATNRIGSATAVSNTLTVPAPAAVGVTPTPTPAAIVPIIALSAAKIVVSDNAAKVPIACAKASCAGSIELTEQVSAKAGKGKKATSKKQTVVLAKGSYSLAAGKSATILVRLTAAGKSALASAKGRKLSAEATVTVAGGVTAKDAVVLSEPVKAKPKPERRK